MPIYVMGEVIRSLRIRNGITQEELAHGICSTSMLSKIENGKAIPRHTFEAIRQRLIGELFTVMSLDSPKEVEKAKLKKRLLWNLYQKNMEEAEQNLMRYETIREKRNCFDSQFYLITKSAIDLEQDGGLRKAEKRLQFAICMTNTDIDNVIRQKHILLSYDELLIYNEIAIAMMRKGERKKGLHMLFYLKEYIENRGDWYQMEAPIYAMILYNVAFVLYENGRWEDANRHCNTGIYECQRLGCLTVLPYLLCLRAKCLLALNHREDARETLRQTQLILGIELLTEKISTLRRFYRRLEMIKVVRY